MYLVDHEEVGLRHDSSRELQVRTRLPRLVRKKPDEDDAPEKRQDRPFGESSRLRGFFVHAGQLAVTLMSLTERLP